MTPRLPLRGLIITGTDTGVGKTIVAAGLLRLARQQGISLVPFKPAETGCASLSRPHDATLLARAAGRADLPLETICPFRFRPPLAPAAAAALAGTRIALATLVLAAHRAASAGDALLIEGAGGVLSPYAPRLTILDLAARLGLPLLLVARNRLGTINHTTLAVREIRRRLLPLLGYILVDGEATSDREQNADLIHSSTGLSPYAFLHYIRRPTPEAAARALGASARLQRDLHRLRPPLRGKLALRASSGR